MATACSFEMLERQVSRAGWTVVDAFNDDIIFRLRQRHPKDTRNNELIK